MNELFDSGFWTQSVETFAHVSAAINIVFSEHWPLFVLSKLALVVLPIYSVRYFNIAMDQIGSKVGLRPVSIYRNLRTFFEKFLAHSAFYIGMGIPIIGLAAVFDFPRLVGFSLTNMLIHEALPRFFSRERFSRYFPEWRRTLGVNLVLDKIILELSIFVDHRGTIFVRESPHSKTRNFIKSSVFRRTDGDGFVEVVLRPFFVPKGKNPRLIIRANPDFHEVPSGSNLGKYIRIDFGDLTDYAMPVYINRYGRQRWLWRTQYWTKFFNEIAGRSYATNPFEITRKFFLVVLGTPLAFIAGNIAVHFYYGGSLNLHPVWYFNYGIIFAFTIGGMYGSSLFSTLIELITWQIHTLRKKFELFRTHFTDAVKRRELIGAARYNPYFNVDQFGTALEYSSAAYRRIRFLVGGIVMGGLCSWGLTQYQGEVWDSFIRTHIQSKIINSLQHEGSGVFAHHEGLRPDYNFSSARHEYLDAGNQLYRSGRQVSSANLAANPILANR